MVGDSGEDEEGVGGLLAVPLCWHQRNVQPVPLVLPYSGGEEPGGWRGLGQESPFCDTI